MALTDGILTKDAFDIVKINDASKTPISRTLSLCIIAFFLTKLVIKSLNQ